jgi:hypothetical protein
MRHYTFERRDKWCYGIVLLGYLAVMVLLFSEHRHLGLVIASILLPFTGAYAGARGHLASLFHQEDSDKKDDHVA